MNREVIIICESMYHGNTKKLADGMAVELKCQVVTSDQACQMDLSRYKVVVLGSGIYFTSHHPKIVAIAKTLQKEQQVVIISTRGCPVVGKYHDTLKKAVQEHGASVIGEFSCRGYDCTGPYNLIHGGNKGKPSERDVLRARKYIRKILPQYCKKIDSMYTKNQHVCIDSAKCMQCKSCVKVCPMKVFDVIDGKVTVTRDDDCIHCNLCVDDCMQGSIEVYHTKLELVHIAKKHASRTSL